MPTFQRDEHVIIRLKTPDVNGKYTTATVSTKIRIKDQSDNTVVAWTAMDVQSAGVHTYAYDTDLDADNGDYTAEMETVNTTDSLKTISKWTFTVEDL